MSRSIGPRAQAISRRQALARVVGMCAAVVTWDFAHAAAVVDPMVRASSPGPRPAAAFLTAVARAGQDLVAVGERGIAIRSADDGRTWQPAVTPVGVLLTGVRFSTEKTGWAVGHSGIVLKTEDGGTRWTRQLDGAQAAQLLLADAKARAGRLAAGASSREVADREQWVKDGADKPFLDILPLDERDCLIVGAFGLALRTKDGGQTWQSWMSRLPNPNGRHLYAVAAAGPVVYIAGEGGLVMRSVDAGESFVALKTSYAGSYFGIVAQDADRALVYGLRGRAMATSDGGTNWAPLSTGIDASLSAGAALPGGRVVVASFAGDLRLSKAERGELVSLAVPGSEPIVGLAATRDGGLVTVGPRGARRIPANLIANS